jgi:hypothetical protein
LQWASHYCLELTGREESVDSACEVAENAVSEQLARQHERLCLNQLGPIPPEGRFPIAPEASIMWRGVALLALFGIGFLSLWGQGGDTPACLPRDEFAPVLVKNPEMKVTFKCNHATPLELIRAVGFQTRLPIGLVSGRDLDALSKTKHSYDLDNADARSSLLKAIEGTGYSIKNEDEVLVIIAGDLAPRQRDLLAHQYSNFRTNLDGTMVEFGMTLEMWMRDAVAVDPKRGYGMSILGSTNDERFALRVPHLATTEEIANQIVSQGSRGMWVFRVSASSPTDGSADSIDIEPYQHYSNRPITRH